MLKDVVYDHEAAPISGPMVCSDDSQVRGQQAVRVDEIRGHILEKINGIRQMHALMKRAVADAGICKDRLEYKGDDQPALTQWQALELQGRMELSMASAESHRVMIEHYKIQIRTFYALLGNG